MASTSTIMSLKTIKSALHPTIKEGSPFSPKVLLKENEA